MKKLDLIIISIVLIIGITIFAIYFKQFNVNIDDAKLEITFKDILLDSIEINQDTHIVYTFEEMDDTSFLFVKEVYVSQDSEPINRTERIIQADMLALKKFNSDHHLHHVLLVTYDYIHMEEASCPNKNCQRMLMTNHITLPIICTNGIVVKYVANEIDILV